MGQPVEGMWWGQVGGRWVVNCSSLARLLRLQLEPEADVPSWSSPLPVLVVTDGENQLPGISNKDPFTYHSGTAGCYVGTF